MKFNLVALSALMLATAAHGRSDTSADENAKAAQSADDREDSPSARRRARDERVSCRQIMPDAGSRLTQRVCLTTRQWRERGGF